MRTALLLMIAIGLNTSAHGQGLGLGKRAPGRADAKALRFEIDLLKAVNALRKRKKLPALTMDEKLRTLAREQAEYGASGDPKAKSFAARLKASKLATHGFRLQYAFGTKAPRVIRDLQKDATAVESLTLEFARIGIGAFWVPADEPYFQVALLVALELDPMAGKTGLTKAETDPTMSRAADQIRRLCYQREIDKDPNLRGTIIFKIVIGAGGHVDEVELLSKMGSAAFNDCAIRQVKAQRFPAPYKDRPVTLNHPMRFAPAHGQKKIGTLTTSQISAAFASARGDFKACYDARVDQKPELEGTIRFSLTVAPDGSIERISVDSDEPNDGPLRSCVLERAKRVRFPPPKHGGPAEVRFPLRFEPPRKH